MTEKVVTLYTDGISMSWIPMIVGVVGITMMMVTGMPTMVRTRFSTPTIGREWMIGELGTVIDDEMGDEVRITVIAAGFDRIDEPVGVRSISGDDAPRTSPTRITELFGSADEPDPLADDDDDRVDLPDPDRSETRR